jgi:hypothetical protein
MQCDVCRCACVCVVDECVAHTLWSRRHSAPSALTDVTNQSAAAMVDVVEPVKTAITIGWDVDALTAEKDVEVEPTPIVATVVEPTTIVPAQPQLLCAQIDPSITALKVVRAPIPAFTATAEENVDTDDEEIVPSARRVQLLYSASGDLIGTQDVAPLPAFHTPADAEEDDDEDAREDLTKLGEVERMVSECASFVPPAPLTLDHAAPITHAAVQGSAAYSSGFLAAGVISSSTVRSVKLDSFSSAEPIPSFLLVAPALTTANIAKCSGFFVGGIDANKIQSKKL